MIDRFGRPSRPSTFAIIAMTASIVANMAAAPMVFAVPTTNAVSSELPARFSLTLAQRDEIEEVLTGIAQDIVSNQERMDGQGIISSPVVRFSEDGKSLIVDLGKGYVPKINGGELEDRLREIETPLTFHMEAIFPVYKVEFLFGGRDIYYYFPEDWRPAPSQWRQEPRSGQLRPHTNSVLVSAGHGIYFHRGYKDWRAAREPANGVTEDFITPVMSADLATYLNDRSEVESVLVRSQALVTHAESGSPWWKVSARYHLKELYPALTDVWNSKGTQDYPLVERDDDIYSRPFFANHLGVDAILHVHTNAESNTSIRGARVYYQTGRVPDSELARSSLFYMAESIHSVPGYEDYPVASAPHEGNYAENREAKMISVIAEVGFHTNPLDAAALQDPAFQKAAMRGFEKGYRLFLAQKPLQKFEIVDHPNVEAKPGESVPVEARFSGYPRFPVSRESSVLSCPEGWTCSGGTQTLAETESPFVTMASCGASNVEAGTTRSQVVFIDADGLSTTTEYELHCTGRDMRH